MSRKAAEYGQFFLLAFWNNVESTKIASLVLLPLRNPNCSGPSMLFDSATSVISLHILMVSNLRRLEGMVIGLYWPGSRESPP